MIPATKAITSKKNCFKSPTTSAGRSMTIQIVLDPIVSYKHRNCVRNSTKLKSKESSVHFPEAIQIHAASSISNRFFKLIFLCYYFVHLSLFRSVDLNSKSFDPQNNWKKNFQLFFFFLFIHSSRWCRRWIWGTSKWMENGWWVLFLLLHSPLSLSMWMWIRMIQLNSWSLLFSSHLLHSLELLWPKNHKQKKKIEKKNSVMNEFTFLRDTLYGRTIRFFYRASDCVVEGDEWRFCVIFFSVVF